MKELLASALPSDVRKVTYTEGIIASTGGKKNKG